MDCGIRNSPTLYQSIYQVGQQGSSSFEDIKTKFHAKEIPRCKQKRI